MCLYIINRKPQVAKRDIVVLKYLRKEGERYSSPCLGTPVTLGELMVAQPKTPHISHLGKDLYDREISIIKGGVIHAKLSEGGGYGNYCAKAIIPAGTEYWMNPFGTEIAAKQMLITEKRGSNESVDIQFFKEILEDAPEKNGVRIGDYQMTDDSFVHPTKKIAKTKVRDIVCGFYEDGSPIVCALEMFRENWNIKYDSRIGEYTSQEKAMKLFNGREVTAQYQKRIDGNDKERLAAFEKCINYRKDKKENWYFGSLGENMTMLDNAVYLNAAHMITGLGFIINAEGWYWSCSEYNSSTSWNCSLCGGKTNCYQDSKLYACRVVPFYASTNKKKV